MSNRGRDAWREPDTGQQEFREGGYNAKRARTLNTSGLIGSALMSFCIRVSRIRKFVAQVSSSKSSVSAPSSMASITLAAILVLPLASSVLKQSVSTFPGSLPMNGEMFTFWIERPSSLCKETMFSDATTNSRPSRQEGERYVRERRPLHNLGTYLQVYDYSILLPENPIVSTSHGSRHPQSS